MEEFYRLINAEEKVPYKSQISLWIYSKMLNNNSTFDNFIMSEKLIDEFNKLIQDNEFRNKFQQMFISEKKTIDCLMNTFLEKPWKIIKPVIWNNNLDNPYFIKNLVLSHRFEIYIDCKFKDRDFDIGLYYGRDGQYNGENAAGIEIKRDMMINKTGNIYIEYSEKHYANNHNWVNSGILKDDNTRFFLIGDIDKYYILQKNDLINIYQRIRENDKELIEKGCRFVSANRETSKGFIIPINVAKEIELTIDDVIEAVSN